MIGFSYVITDSEGLHARPIAKICSELQQFESAVRIKFANSVVLASNPMALMALGIKQGDELAIEVEGSDEVAAAQRLREILSRY